MPPIPKQVSRRVTPSGRVGDVAVPFDIADTGAGIEARGLGALGVGIGNLTQAISQIKQVEGESQANTASVQADSRMQVLMEELRSNNDPDTYETEKGKVFERFSEIEPPGEIGKSIFGERLELAKLQWDSDIKVAELRKRQNLIENAAIANYEIAIGKGDLEKALELTESDFEIGSITESERDKRIAESPKLVKKILSQNAVQSIKNATVLNPEATKIAVTSELKGRKEGKISDEFALLTNEDLESIRDYADTIGEKQTTKSTANLNAATVEAYSKIRDGAIDLDAMIDRNDADPLQSDEDKIKFAEKLPTYFSKVNSTKAAAFSSDNDVYDQLTQASERVERGAMNPVDFEDMYAKNRHKLTTEDQRKIRDKDIVATRTMQNRTFGDAMITTRATFVSQPEDAISSIKLARRNAELIQDIPSINNFNIALKKNQAEQWNYGRFRNALREQINQNPEWSSKQINTAKDLLIEQLDKTEAELLREFDEQNPNEAITKTSPDIAFDDIWADMSQEDKTLLWAGRMQGISVDVLLTGEQVAEAKVKKFIKTSEKAK